MFSVTFMRSWPSAFEMGTIRLAEAAAAAGTPGTTAGAADVGAA